MTSLAMSVYTDMIRSDPESRSRLRVTPDTIFNLPNHHAICSWISRGARAPAFLAQTLPLETDARGRSAHHLEAQRERGCFVPDALPDPMPDLDCRGMRRAAVGGRRTRTRREPVEAGGRASRWTSTRPRPPSTTARGGP